jgi:GTP-binding protein EngB required for normal cell division
MLEYYRIPFKVILTKSKKLSNKHAIVEKNDEKLLGKTPARTMLFFPPKRKGKGRTLGK